MKANDNEINLKRIYKTNKHNINNKYIVITSYCTDYFICIILQKP